MNFTAVRSWGWSLAFLPDGRMRRPVCYRFRSCSRSQHGRCSPIRCRFQAQPGWPARDDTGAAAAAGRAASSRLRTAWMLLRSA